MVYLRTWHSEADVSLQLAHTPGQQRPPALSGVTSFPQLHQLLKAKLCSSCSTARAAGACPGTGTQQGLATPACTGSPASAAQGGDEDEHAGNPHITLLRGSGRLLAALVPLHSAFLSPRTGGLWKQRQKVETEFQITPVRSCCRSNLNSHFKGKIRSTSTSAFFFLSSGNLPYSYLCSAVKSFCQHFSALLELF